VGLADLYKQFQDWIASFRSGKEKEVKAGTGEVLLISAQGKPLEPPGDEDPIRSGYDATQRILAEPLRREAERIEVIARDDVSTVRYFVDGVPIEGMTLNKTESSAAISLLKAMMGLSVQDRRKPQTGTMKVGLDRQRRELQITTAGSTAGESMVIEVDRKSRYDLTLDQLGLTEGQLKSIDGSITQGGVVLVAAPKGHGLTSLLYALIRRHDAFLSHIQTIERDPQADLEGITQNNLPVSATVNDEIKLAAWIASQEPDVVMASQVEDPRSAVELINLAGTGRRVYIGIRAGSAMDAIAAWRKLVGDDQLAMKHLCMVVSGRLLRKLCEACKIDFVPDPETLRKIGLSPERVTRLYQARTTPLRDQKGNPIHCDFCHDLGFHGRTGVYEVLLVDDEVRSAILQGASAAQLKMVFKKQRQRYMQEVALDKAADGHTSLHEIARVLRAEAAVKPKPAATQ
jgi:type IV pilus assembly protein PilB